MNKLEHTGETLLIDLAAPGLYELTFDRFEQREPGLPHLEKLSLFLARGTTLEVKLCRVIHPQSTKPSARGVSKKGKQ